MINALSRGRYGILMFVSLLAVGALGDILWAQEIKAGDTVTVIKWGAEFKLGDKVIDTVGIGKSFEVGKVVDDLLWIEKRNGYLSRKDVVLFHEAVAHFTKAIRDSPKSSNTYRNRAIMWGDRGEIDIAIADYSQAILLEPVSAQLHHDRGLSFMEKGDYDRAIADFNEAIRLGEEYPGYYVSRGDAWKAKGEYEKALADYKHIAKPSRFGFHGTACHKIAWVYATCQDAELRNGQLAIEWAKKALEINRDASSPWYKIWPLDALAAAYAENGNFSNAIESENQAIELARSIGASVKAIEKFEARRALYNSGLPYREPLPTR